MQDANNSVKLDATHQTVLKLSNFDLASAGSSTNNSFNHPSEEVKVNLITHTESNEEIFNLKVNT